MAYWSHALCLLLALAPFFVNSGSPVRYVSHKNCNNKKRGTIVSNPANCSQYIMCNGLRSTLGECPPEAYFNAEMLSCDKGKHLCPDDTIKLDVKPAVDIEQEVQPIMVVTLTTTTIVPTTTTETPTTTTVIPLYMDGRPLCSLWHDLQFSHPHNCAYYYQCVKGFLTIRRCYSGYLWDPQVQRCVLSSETKCQYKNETNSQLRKPMLF